jgi:N-acetyl-gamma-glutamyl-phosphate reductase
MHDAQKAAVGLIGASGYAGVEATRLLANHGQVELRFATSERWAGEAVGEHLPLSGPAARLRYAPLDQSVALAEGCTAVLLATPAEVSLELAPKLLAKGVRVIDLSGAFRLRDSALYPRYYGFEHKQLSLLPGAYGLPELGRQGLAEARLVANPGCYATSAALALAPLVRAGLVVGDLVVNAASGVTGAGRKGSEELSFCEVDEDYRAYRVHKHQHTPEIAQALGWEQGALTFTAHLRPLTRGILATCWARLRPGVEPAQVSAAYETAYGREPFVALARSPEAVHLKAVVGTNRCLIGFACEGGRVLVTAVLDNLVKGAAGQALQNLNIVLGLEETTGLGHLGGFHP